MLTLADPLEHARRCHPRRVAVTDGDTVLDHATLVERCAALGRALRARGLEPGDRVALLAGNGHRYVEALFGVPAAGLVVVPLNTRLAAAELTAIVGDCRPRVLLADRPAGALATVVDEVIDLGEGYEKLLASAPPPTAGAPALPGEDDVAALFYTGGTTGTPKGVMLTHRNLVANAFHKTLACSLTPDDVYLAAPAMFHVAGTAPLVGLLWLGSHVVTLPTFDAAACLDLVERHRVTVLIPVPTMVAALVDEQRRAPRDVSSLRLLGHAGSPIAAELVAATHETFPGAELAQFYGATETASVVTCLRREEAALGTPLLGSTGRPVPGVAVRVLAPDGTEVDPGGIGEVVVRGPNVTTGYWGNPDATAAAIVEGWYHTGDLGRFDDEGHLFVVDRLKDMIVSGGENVYSVEVEDALYRHPAVAEAAVFGVPDPVWGEAVHAVVVPAAGWSGGDAELVDELRAHCRRLIAGYKVPKAVELRREPLPKSGPGKILKRALRDPWWADGPPVPR